MRRRSSVRRSDRRNFNSHTPHGVRPEAIRQCIDYYMISTHTPHTGCDIDRLSAGYCSEEFQLTHPTRGATHICQLYTNFVKISTHTPHTGCDESLCGGYDSLQDFNSHTPHGVRHGECQVSIFAKTISTHTPHTGCDATLGVMANRGIISTHTPHTGCDSQSPSSTALSAVFQLTHPTRGATRASGHASCFRYFNSHTPHGVRLYI